MAHWAEIDENNIVLRVTVGDNNDPDEGYSWLVNNLGGHWIQTSYNANFRNKFAGIGDIYLEEYDVFVSPQPYSSWNLNLETFIWEAPIAQPIANEGERYIWNEELLEWVLV